MKYCKEIFKQISDDLKMGMSRTDTCDDVGISFETFTEWCRGRLPEAILSKCKNPEEAEAKKQEFIAMIKKSESECKKRCIGIIQRAAINTWQAAAWWLERKYKEEFALKTTIGGDKANPIVLKFDKVDERL